MLVSYMDVIIAFHTKNTYIYKEFWAHTLAHTTDEKRYKNPKVSFIQKYTHKIYVNSWKFMNYAIYAQNSYISTYFFFCLFVQNFRIFEYLFELPKRYIFFLYLVPMNIQKTKYTNLHALYIWNIYHFLYHHHHLPLLL